MIFGQVIIGPPGSGKTTYCKAMNDFLSALGRKVAIVNIDPANDVPYKPTVDITDLITVEEVMSEFQMGPNGALVYCMEYLLKNFDWLLGKLNQFPDCYFLFDCPGQVELYTHNSSIRKIFAMLKEAEFSLTAVHLVDSFYCSDPGKFIAISLTSLFTMFQMEMPHVNVLSKCDMIEKYGKLQYGLNTYSEVANPAAIASLLSDDPFLKKYKALNEALANVLENYGYVSYLMLSVKEKDTMAKVLKEVDKANGYIFGVNEETRSIQSMLSCTASVDLSDSTTSLVQEKYMSPSSEALKDKFYYGR